MASAPVYSSTLRALSALVISPLATGTYLPAPLMDEVRSILIEHVKELHTFYGEFTGVRFARKHVSWYMQVHDQEKTFRSKFLNSARLIIHLRSLVLKMLLIHLIL